MTISLVRALLTPQISRGLARRLYNYSPHQDMIPCNTPSMAVHDKQPDIGKRHSCDAQPPDISLLSLQTSNTPIATSTPPLPAFSKLSAADFRMYNGLAERMDYYHNHLREKWNILFSSCTSSRRPSGMSIRQFLALGLDFCKTLHVHHSIEEKYIYPMLATKMPQFQTKKHLLGQHEEIEAGLDKLADYLERCKSGEMELRLKEMKEMMETFGKVLWAHLDEEVLELGAEVMRKYWSKQEMARMMF